MSKNKIIVSNILEIVKPLLSNEGFIVKAADNYILKISNCNEIIGWVNLCITKKSNYVCASPNVGISHLALEKIHRDIYNLKFNKYQSPTILTSIGYLLPKEEYISWYFEDGDDDLKTNCEEMCKAIIDYGKPFMEKYSSTESLINLLCDSKNRFKYIYRTSLIIKLPIAYYLMKRYNAIQDYFVQQFNEEVELKDKQSGTYKSYLNFAKELYRMSGLDPFNLPSA